MFEVIRILIDVLFILNYFFFFIIIFGERRNPRTTWAWLMVTILVPYFGFIIYLTIGLEAKKYRIFAEKSKHNDTEIFKEYVKIDSKMSNVFEGNFRNINRKDILKIKGKEHFNDMIYLNLISDAGAFTDNNEVELYHEGNKKFAQLLEDIRKAKKFIHMQYYIFKADALGLKILNALTEKAKEGLEIKLMLDGVGSRGLTRKKCYLPLVEAGGEVGFFLVTYVNFMRINFRNHRKLAIIDGEIGYIGGLNIGDEYLGIHKRYGFWRDSHIRIRGDAVKQMELRFIMDWNFSNKKDIIINEKYFPILSKKKGASMQIVSSGPDTKWPNIHYAYTKMISEANKYIYIQTPYFIPDDSIFESLKIAALSGIDVRIIIPGNPDHPFVYWAALSYLGELLEVGVKCYRYERGFVHSKLMLVDGFISSVGTANMDIRSFKLNFEINAFIYDEEVTNQFEKEFLNDIKHDCTQFLLEEYRKRSSSTKVKESLSRLLSPIL